MFYCNKKNEAFDMEGEKMEVAEDLIYAYAIFLATLKIEENRSDENIKALVGAMIDSSIELTEKIVGAKEKFTENEVVDAPVLDNKEGLSF